MYSYEQLKRRHGRRVSQTIDSPILIVDYFDLSDAFSALFVVLFFGIILASWKVMMILLVFVLGAAPIIKRKNNRGVLLHWPYRRLGMSLPGLVNPKGKRKFSD